VLGDFVDQGRESREVIDRLIDVRRRCQLEVIQGNHEEMMLAARTNEKALRYWENCGGVATLNSYRFGGTLADVPNTHWEFIESCVAYVETNDAIFTHANFDPHLPMTEQSDHTLRWALLDPDDVHCHDTGKTVIVGHTEQRNGEILDVGCVKCIDTACCRYGWLSAVELHTGEVWQASRWGLLREPGEATQLGRLDISRA
jgi:serine/threonine protein phosphatase 1